MLPSPLVSIAENRFCTGSDAEVDDEAVAVADVPLFNCCNAISASSVSLVSDAVGEPVSVLAEVAPGAGVSGAIAMVIVVAVVLDEDEMAESCDSSEDSS
jgi:hypothetical protein